MRLRFSLFTKILLWFLLNLLVLGAVFLTVFNLQFGFAPDSPLFAASNRLDRVARLITDEIGTAGQTERDAILQRYSLSYKIEFLLYANTGERLAGQETQLPAEVLRKLGDMPPPPPPRAGNPPRPQRRPEVEPGPPPRGPRPEQIFKLRTTNPTRYWAGVPVLVFEPGQFEPVRATLLAVSDSISGHGLFFDPTPWLFIIALVLALSILLWLPFVRSLTVTIKQMTYAAQQIAEERFDALVDEGRSDELGRLGAAINQLAARLSGFVDGQKRFLGDISHELNSPLARMQFALSILDERVDPAQQSYVADAQEEVRLMSQLVSELLAFAKAGMKTAELKLVNVPLLPLVQQICAREAAGCDVKIEIADSTAVLAQPELLSRAMANVLRNAARYAGGPLTITAQHQHDQIKLAIADHGPGAPPEALNRLFDPFYRLEPDRARATGGSGLGLAIAKACIEACRGTVAARNLSPSGLEISIVLPAAA